MKILHLDGSSFFQKVVQRGTIAGMYELTGCSSIKEAKKHLATQEFDLILTGQELEDGSAADFLTEIAGTEYHDIPVIMLTSSDTMKLRETYFELGVIDFISKNGFTQEKLNDHIDNINQQDVLIEELAKASIAIIDDSQFSIKVIKKILGLYDIKDIDTYTNPEDLLVSEKKYDVYMVDMVLPNISGKQLVMTLRQEHPIAVIIVISSLGNYKTVLHALESGADDYIIKPFDARLLTARLKSNFRNFLMMAELEKRRKEMEVLAVTDGLTGAKNRRFALDQLEKEIQRSKRHGGPLSILLLDLDNFKTINDTYGHAQGDNVLLELSKMFLADCRDIDIFGRYGGEEFVFIMPETSLPQAVKTAERLREKFSLMKFTASESYFSTTFSGGVVQWKGEPLSQLLKKSDLLLYKAKDDGRNTIKY